MRWIKASERLPELDKDVCLRWQGEQYGSGRFYKHYSNIECDFTRRGTYREPSFELIEWLDESIPVSIEDEAKALYPIAETTNYDIAARQVARREAHITCARMYVDTIERLEGELEQSLLLYNSQTATIFKLTGENNTMRRALEEILRTNHDNHERVIEKVKSIATEALKQDSTQTK